MKSITLVIAAAIAAPAIAQSLANLPQCAINCAIAALPSQCALTDVACICEQSSYIESLEPCVESSCSPANQTAALSGAVSLCAAAGVTLSIPGTGSSSAPVTSAPASSSSAPASTTAAATTTTAKTNSTNTTTKTTSTMAAFTGAAPAHTYVSGALIAGFGALIALF